MSTSTSRNIAYRTAAIARYFESHRMRWDQFYPSERWVLERLATRTGIRRVLDVGCAAGGLGLALEERFTLEQYVGVEINPQAVETARARQTRYRSPVTFHLGDILEMPEVPGGPFDLVANLSCSDWNIETRAITDACWRHVAPGGSLLISLRLTTGPSVNDFNKSYQFIRYEGAVSGDEEKANYVVFNVHDALHLFADLQPRASDVLGYGYWGTPSATAVTPHDRLVFAVFAVTKATVSADCTSELHFPLSLWDRVPR
jgi:SAM-dependent methyltransferase